MKTFKSITILLFATLSFTVWGQSDTKTENPYIEVTGTAEKEIIPDEIYILITIHERHERKKKITIDKQLNDLKEALKSIDVPLENLSLSDANANYIRVRWTKKDVITKNEYLLKVGNALTVRKVFEKLDELKIVDAYISKVTHSKMLEFKKEVRIMAIKAAKEKADYLLAAIGEQTGRALEVNEESPVYLNNNSYLNVRGTNYYVDGVKLKKPEKEVIQFQKIKLRAVIYVKFEIKQKA